MITKAQAQYNLTLAYYEYKLASRLFFDCSDNDLMTETHIQYRAKDAKYSAMRQAYLDCEMLTWVEVDQLESKYKFDKSE